MTHAQQPISITPQEWTIIAAIHQKYVPHTPVWAFGSRVTDDVKPFSDLDLAIISETPLSPDARIGLADDFAESDLPFKVDIIEWATTSAAFRSIIQRRYVVFQPGALNR
jgi:predicted nucleotidyltransferase